MMVSMFQLAVVVTIGTAWLIFGKRASLYVTIAWSVWTLAAVQMGWLVILQGIVAWVTFAFLPADDSEEREQLVRRIKTLLVLGLLGGAGFGAWLMADHRRSSPPEGYDQHGEAPYSESRVPGREDCTAALEWDERKRHAVPLEYSDPRPRCSKGHSIKDQWNDEN